METDLDDQVCTHKVCDRLNLSSLFPRDESDVVNEQEYKLDPYSELRESECAGTISSASYRRRWNKQNGFQRQNVWSARAAQET